MMIPSLARLLLGAGILLCFSAASGSAQDIGAALQHFDEGNQRYRSGEYRGALDAYERVADAGYVSGVLYYNMGNAFYRTDQLGQAVRYYRRARRMMPDNPELNHNLSIVRSRLVDEFSRVPDPFWRPAWESLVRRLGSTGMFAAGMFFYVLASVVLALRIRRGPNAWRRRILAASGAAGIIFVMLGFTASMEGATRREGVVLLDEVTLVNEPEGRRSDQTIHEGLVVRVVAEHGSWLEVRLPNGATGWLRAESLGEI